MITLHRADTPITQIVHLNQDHIITIEPDAMGAKILHTKGWIIVSETLTQILKLLKDKNYDH